MKYKNVKTEKRMRIKKKIRTRISGTNEIPRLSVFRSNQCIYAQLIDDTSGKTLAAASDAKLASGSKAERALKVGAMIAEKAKEAKITKAVFDRNGFKYTGRIKSLADEARKSGLQF
ncbi:MAG: 50S ribosomal protein L18 [Candidatus Pacebacteria bacterium]|jgi:large subunit ribosomal protein L18|nr:50S ribosomal protein L18 [Candidatus Paceibacterota bacterium]